MQNTTANYKLEINKPSRKFECKITIGNNIYTNEDLVNLTLEYAQPQEGFAIGNTISQSLDLTLLNRRDIIYSTSQIKLEIGLKIGSTIEHILMGIFNIDDIEKTDYTTKFTAYDNMIKFETDYFSELGDKPTLQQVVNELSNKTGVEFTGSLPAYTVSKLGGFSCREVLSYIASICGGNAVITRDGKFTIKSLSEAKKSIDGNNYFDYKREEVKYKIGKISCQVDENNILSKGSTGTDSMELGFENPWVTETILNDLYNKLDGLSYLGYSMKWQGDLSLDPYDIVVATDIKNVVRKIPVLYQKISYTGGLTSEIGARGESKNKNNFSSSGSTTNKVNRAVIEQAIIKEALIEKANIKDVEAVSIRTQILEAKTAKIEEAIIDVAHIKDLNSINAAIQNLIASDVKINTALINKADITDLNAVQGNISSLDAKIANIQSLVNGNLSSENIQAGGITSDKLTIENGFITNAMIASLDVAKVNAGDISTNKFRIVSDNGGIEIVGATQQFKDKNNKVRIQMGQDTQGNFNFILRGEDGTTTLIDHTGIKEKAIADNLIKGNMVATDAIGEKQINYNSLITGLNKDTNTRLIKASKVAIDFVGQSLEVAFNSLKSSVDNTKIGGRNLIIKKDAYQNKFLDMTGNLVGNSTTDAMREYIKVKPGEILTFQKENSDEYFRYNWYDINKQFISRRPDRNNVFQWTVPEDTYYIWVSYPNIGNVKIERGNKPTDFSPAPEDIEGSIESVKQITESNSTTINVMQGQINTAINNTKIAKDGKTILLKDDYNRTVSKVDSINNTIGTHTTKINELTNNITSVDTKVNSIERDLEGTKSIISSNTSLIDELNSTVTNNSSTIAQLQNKISLKVEATDIDYAKKEAIKEARKIKDTRNTNENPHWYFNNFPNQTITEFKIASVLGVVSSTVFGTLETKVPWDNSSGGYPVQTFRSNSTATFQRKGISDTTWSSWIQLEDAEGSQLKADKALEFSKAFTTTEVTKTNNKVASIETDLTKITQKVASTESIINTHTVQLENFDNKINTAQTTAKNYTDGKITAVNQTITNKIAEIKTTTDNITSSISKVEQIATSSLQSKMLYTDSTFQKGLNDIKIYNNAGNGNVVITRVSKTSDCPTTSGYMIQIISNGVANPGLGGFTFGTQTRANAIFVTKFLAKIPAGYKVGFGTNKIGNNGKHGWLTDNVGTGTWKEYIYKVNCGDTGTFSTTNFFYLNGNAPVTWYLAMATVYDITETNNIESRIEIAEQKITPSSLTTTISEAITGGAGSISTTQFVMDKNGLTIKNGALVIQNKVGTTVFNSDTNGNLIFNGTAKSQSGARWVGLDSGGITFQDSQKNEQMLRIAISYFNENRDINGVNLTLAKFGDYIRISHIDKADLTTGWSSTDTQYNFMDFWSDKRTIGSTTYEKGISVYAPMHIYDRVKLRSGTAHLAEISGAVSWNNGTGTVNNLLGVYGDNGAILGYKSGDSFNARFLVSEGSHPGTGDHLISWGNYNFNGYTFHNANIVANSLSVIGSKNCLQETKSYDSRLINAYETAEYYFGDLGFGKINSDGECLIYIDDIFLECINTNAEYHVFTQIYNKGLIETIERYKTYFIVKGDPGTSFSWEIKAKRLGYENNRLDLEQIEIDTLDSGVVLFSDSDFKADTSENILLATLTFNLDEILLKKEE